MRDRLRLTDNVVLVLTAPDGREFTRRTHNLVTAQGRTAAAEQLLPYTSPVPSHIAIGSGDRAARLADRALQDELARADLTASRKRNVVELVAEYPAGVGTGRISEAGVLDGEDRLWARATFEEMDKRAIDTLTITWLLTAE